VLTDEELIELIKGGEGGEGERVEFTSAAQDMDKLRQAICAFANDLPNHNQPGVLFVGLKDNGDCAGLSVDDALLKTLGGLRSDGKIHPFPAMTVGKKKLQGCEVAVIQVMPSENPPVKVDGRCWIRTGPQRAQATAEEERRLTEKRRWGNLAFDMHGVAGATVEDDLDMQKFETEYLPAAVSPEVLEENARSAEDQLRALRLVTRDGTPTATAILMLGVDPRRWFPGAYIQFVRYDGGEVTDPVLDQVELSGTLSGQLREADFLLKRNITTALDMSGDRHVEKPDYPFVALRELVRNAVIHRNYDNSTAPVRISWFRDCLQISSPGSVYGEVTRQNFGDPDATSYRNPAIAEAMKYQGFMEHFGTGIAKARKALKENGNPPPELRPEDTFVFVTIHKRP